MLINLIQFFLPESLKKRWTLDEEEQLFIKTVGAQSRNENNLLGHHLLIQMPIDYYDLSLFCVATMQLKAKKTSGLWHQNIMSAPRGENFPGLKRQMRRLFNYFDKLKWSKLYAAIGVENVNSLEVGWFTAIGNYFQAKKIWQRLRSKEDVLGIELRGTPCGDLIYDTYLRYRIQPTVDLSDPYLCTIIAQALNAQSSVRNFLKKEKINLFLTSYTSYVQHGIPARELLRAGVKVYSAGNLSQYFKELSISDSLHTTSHWLYGDQFKLLPNQSEALVLAQKELERRFEGGIDKATLYMKVSAYTPTGTSMPEGVEGVVFLHDFFDSPHCHRDMLFVDFLEWADFTLKVIEENNLPLAVKPHPNQLPESQEIVDKLQLKYPNVKWLPTSLSNKPIFHSGIKCGISVYGTILHELAYHGIPALAAGDHPHTAFQVAYTPKSIAEYEKALCGFRKLSLVPHVRGEVLAFYYMHNINSREGLGIHYCGEDLRKIDAGNSRGLKQFMAIYPKFQEKSSRGVLLS